MHDMIHAKPRKRSLVEKLSSRGLCKSHERIQQEISSTLAHSVCSQFKKNIFNTGAVDNLDHNPSSRNAMESFHRAAISTIQFPIPENHGSNMH